MLIEIAGPALALCVNASLLALIARISSRRSMLYYMGSLLACLIALSAGEMGLILSGTNLTLAVVSVLTISLGMGFFCFIYLYFALEFPIPGQYISERATKGVMAALFLVGMGFFFQAAVVGTYLTSLDLGGRDYYSLYQVSVGLSGPLYGPSVVFMMLEFIAGFLLILYTRRSERNAIARRRLDIVLIAGVLLFLLWPASQAVSDRFPVPGALLNGMSYSIVGGILAFVIVRYNLFGIEQSRVIGPAGAANPLEGGHYYLVAEKDPAAPEFAYSLFREQLNLGKSGVLVTAGDPVEVRRKYGLGDTPVFHITSDAGLLKSIVSDNRGIIRHSPTEFIANAERVIETLSGVKEGALIVDCLELLISENTARTENAQKMLEGVRKIVGFIASSGSVMILPVRKEWVRGKSPGDLIKTRKLFRNTNVFPAILMSRLMNESLDHLVSRDPADVRAALERLKLSDEFFVRTTYDGEILSLNSNYRERFSLQDMIHRLKQFAAVFPLKPSGHEMLLRRLEEFGVSKYEYDIEPGNSYMVRMESADLLRRVIPVFLENGYSGLYLGRMHPKSAERLPKGAARMLTFRWVSETGKDERAVPPKFEYIQREIEDFLEARPKENVIVALDNIEFLVKHAGDFDTVHLFLARIKDLVTARDGILLVPIGATIFSAEQQSLLRQEFSSLEYA